MSPVAAPALTDFLAASGASLVLSHYIIDQAKPFLEAGPLPPTAKLHDSIMQLLTVAVAIAIALIANAASSGLTGQTAFLVVAQGLLSGLGSVGLYHAGSPAPKTPKVPPIPRGSAPVQQGPADQDKTQVHLPLT